MSLLKLGPFLFPDSGLGRCAVAQERERPRWRGPYHWSPPSQKELFLIGSETRALGAELTLTPTPTTVPPRPHLCQGFISDSLI